MQRAPGRRPPTQAPIYVSRLTKLPLLDADGAAVGRIADVVLLPPTLAGAPRVIGFVAAIERRRIFVNDGKVADLDTTGARLRSAIDLRQFSRRAGELLVEVDVVGKRVGTEIVNDVGLTVSAARGLGWEVATVSLRSPRPLRSRSRARIVAWSEVVTLFDAGPMGRELAQLHELHPAELAGRLRALPVEQRRALLFAMDDERIADVLEEMDEEDQVAILTNLDTERAADVLEEMEPDDAADLLGEMDPAMRVKLLREMEPDEAAPVRRLLLYDAHTAGGLMNPEPVIVRPDTTVAECIARVRHVEVPAALAAQVFVTEAPVSTPTGRYLGLVGFQRLLREPPGAEIVHCIETDSVAPITPDMPETVVAERLAAYNLFALPVCDETGRLLGAVTADDVLDRALPDNWREEHGWSARRGGGDLSTPRRARLSLGIHYDPEAFGEFSETIARTIGTARFLVIQTVVIIVWVVINIVTSNFQFDPYPFIFLTLVLSLQAAYVAPLILLAENRQADRDRGETERDREVGARTQADTEYLARELSSIRLALADVVTSEDLRDAVDRIEERLRSPDA